MAAKFQQDNSGQVEEGIADLKSLREFRGLTLDDVFQATRISIKNLEAVESGNFHTLPPPVYARAYFHAYAKILDCDEGPFIGRYEKYLATASQVIKANADTSPGQEICFPKKRMLQLAGVAVVCVLVFLMFAYFNFRGAVAPLDPTAPRKADVESVADAQGVAPPAYPDSSAPATIAGSGVNTSPRTEKILPEPAEQMPPDGQEGESRAKISGISARKPSVLIITAREETWLRIKEDEAAPYQIMMRPGERIMRSGSRYALDIGNAGGVSLEFQGKIAQELGKSGQVVHLQLP